MTRLVLKFLIGIVITQGCFVITPSYAASRSVGVNVAFVDTTTITANSMTEVSYSGGLGQSAHITITPSAGPTSFAAIDATISRAVPVKFALNFAGDEMLQDAELMVTYD